MDTSILTRFSRLALFVSLSFLCSADDHNDLNHEQERCEKMCAREASSTLFEDCLQECEGRGVIFVVIAIIIVLILVLLCLWFFLYGRIMKKCYLAKQKKKRKPTSTGLTVTQFQNQLQNLQSIFTDGNRDLWVFSCVSNGTPVQMQWFTFQTKRISDYEHEIKMTGQDLFGVWNAQGSFVNTEKGITVWFTKQYEKGSFRSGVLVIFEMIKNENGSYEGQWYTKGGSNESGVCGLKRRGEDDELREEVEKKEKKEQREGGDKYELISYPDSDMHM